MGCEDAHAGMGFGYIVYIYIYINGNKTDINIYNIYIYRWSDALMMDVDLCIPDTSEREFSEDAEEMYEDDKGYEYDEEGYMDV